MEPLLKDDTISDILVNTYNSIYVERRGVLEKTSLTFQDNRHLMHIIDKMYRRWDAGSTNRHRWWMRVFPTVPASMQLFHPLAVDRADSFHPPILANIRWKRMTCCAIRC